MDNIKRCFRCGRLLANPATTLNILDVDVSLCSLCSDEINEKPKIHDLTCFHCGTALKGMIPFYLNLHNGENVGLCSSDCANAAQKDFDNNKLQRYKRLQISPTTPLNVYEKQELFQTMFGFTFTNENRDENFVLYDEEGYEFYSFDKNLQFKFITLADFFSYTAHRAKLQGYADAQYTIRKVLGIK